VGISKFKDDPSLSEQEIETLAAWADAGAVRGNRPICRRRASFENSDICTSGSRIS